MGKFGFSRSSRALLAGILCLLFMGFGAGQALASKKDGVLNAASEVELESVDNYFNTAREGILVSRMLWDGLIYRVPSNFKYKGNLATKYRWVNKTTLEFTLRKGVKFHNGEAFDADDVVYTLNWVSNPKNKVKTQRNVNWIKKAKRINKYKVQVALKKPFPAALEYFAGPVVIYPNEYYAKVGPAGMGVKPVGTGPYKAVSVDLDKQRFEFAAYSGYHRGPKPKASIKRIVYRTIPESNTQFAELLSGGIDWIWKVPADQAEKLRQAGRFTVKNASTMRIGYVSFDAAARVGKNPMNDKRVRQAIAHAINRQEMVDNLVKGASKVVHSACFPTQFGCTSKVKKYKYDPKKAKRLLAQAGYPNGFETDFYAYRNRDYAEAMIGYLGAVGIKAKLTFLKYSALRDKVHAGQVPFQFMTWGSYSINDVSAITSNFFKGGVDDYARDKRVIKALDRGDTSTNSRVRKTNYGKALRRIAGEMYWLPLFSYNTNYVFSKDVNFTPTEDEIPRFFTAKWK